MQLEFSGQQYRSDLTQGHDISIPMVFDGVQPNHFGAQPATASAMKSGDYIGDTRQGGSCNAQVLTLTPHCNGTHTECVGHITDERISITEIATESIMPAGLISVVPVPAEHCKESADPAPEPADRLISAESIGSAWSSLPGGEYPALVIRTLPNPENKKNRIYTPAEDHPYFSLEAIQLLLECGVRHLLVDTPSIDRYQDKGKLSGHRRFWGVDKGERTVRAGERRSATITEMVFVNDAIADGLYLLNLQIPAFMSDAAPSRPVLYPLEAL